MTDRKVYKLAVVCGSGVASSAMIGYTVREKLAAKGVHVEIDTWQVKSIEPLMHNYDLIVSAVGKLPFETDIPVVSGMAFMSGVGEDKAIDEITRRLGASQR